jgi:hypothetical protein
MASGPAAAGAAGGDGAAVGEQFAVVKHDDAVAQHAPALLGVTGGDPGLPGNRAPAIADIAVGADTLVAPLSGSS